MKLKIFATLMTVLLATGLLTTVSCSLNDQSPNALDAQRAAGLRPLTTAEREADFELMLSAFKAYYGPYNYKESRFDMNIEKSARALKEQAVLAKTDEEFAGYIMQFGAMMRDGHVQVQIDNTASGIARYRIPIFMAPIEGKALIADIKEDMAAFTQFAIGDEVIAIDGKGPFELLPTILKYRRSAQPLSDLHNIVFAFIRPSYMTDILPQSPVARVQVRKPNGQVIEVQIPWVVEKYNKDLDNLVQPKAGLDFSIPWAHEFNSVIDLHRGQMGQTEPVFLNAKTQGAYKFIRIYPSDAARKKYGLADTEKPAIYAALYKYNGKTILLVRLATYYPTDFSSAIYMKAYQALFEEYESVADVLVLDQTHNPGGNGSYCTGMFNIIAKDGDTQAVQQCRADRLWINEFKLGSPEEPLNGSLDSKLTESFGLEVEKAYDEGKFLSPPIPIFSGKFYAEALSFRWTKPSLVLIDELAGSCGDVFPMLVKANKTTKLFGQTTMGLGGNVEEVTKLFHSQIHVRMTRGLFHAFRADGNYQPSDYVENNGVAPDYSYAHSVEDFRNGYVGYVKAFSDKAIEQIK